MANWELVIEGRQGTKDNLNVLHYQDFGGGPPDWTFAANAIRGHLSDHIITFCGSLVTWVGITVREDVPGSVGVLVPFTAGVLTGTNATPSQMMSASLLVRKIGSGLVRPVRGWAFQSGLVVDGLDAASRWEAPVIAATLDYWEDIRLMADGLTTDLRMVIKARNPSAPNTQAYTPVAAFSASGVPRHLDSRIEIEGS
jgi:hypothetical protein